jgi:hypothetical protein
MDMIVKYAEALSKYKYGSSEFYRILEDIEQTVYLSNVYSNKEMTINNILQMSERIRAEKEVAGGVE